MRPSRKIHSSAIVCWQEGHATPPASDDGRTANKCIKKDFFPCTISLIGCVSRRLLRMSSWNWLGADSPGCCVCTAPTRLNEAVCLQSMGLSDPWLLGSSLFLFPADIYFKGA